MPLRRIVCLLLLSSTSIAGCSPEPTQPAVHAISGRVRLTGYLVDGAGHFAGTRVVEDADGVKVELVYAHRVVGEAVTVGGGYRFTGLQPGAYVARTHVIGGLAAETSLLTISNRDVQSVDTLQLESRGDIYPVPNPTQPSSLIYFDVPGPEHVEVGILGMGGQTIRTLFSGDLDAGLHQVYWDGNDETGHPAMAALFWVTLVAGDDIRAQLLFR